MAKPRRADILLMGLAGVPSVTDRGNSPSSVPMASGLYVVALTTVEPISVNAHDPRFASRSIKANREHCKFGKARDLARRECAYWRTFGREFVRFHPIALLDEIDRAERMVLVLLSEWRVRGSTGRRSEWLAGISAADVEQMALDALGASNFAFAPIGRIAAPANFDP